MPPRSIWNGTITLGLMTVPVKVHSATEDRALHFHQVHATDGAPIKQRRICTLDEAEVPYEEVAKGYPLDDGSYVLLSTEEVAAAAGERSRTIALEELVDAAEIDPICYERSYHLGAGSEGRAAYRLLHDALDHSERVGIGRWVFHNREYLVAVRAVERVLVMQTLRFADELVAPATLALPEPSRAPTDRELEMAETLVEALHGEPGLAEYADTYRERLLALLESRAAGREPELPEAPEPAPAPDLMAALEASVKASRRRAPVRQTPAAARKSPARKPRAAGRGSSAKTRSKG